MAHILGPRNLKDWMPDTIVCCFYIYSPELASLGTEFIAWLLKVKYVLHCFRWEAIFYFKNLCYKNLQVSLVYSDNVIWF